ncbi:MAG: type II toxin-antitoxin system PemK/MazF family toxin [Dehalococcoidia bacterium]
MKGKIVLVPFPFTDLTAAKLRPALVIYEGPRDAVIAFISSKVAPERPEASVVITKQRASFQDTGLKMDSVINLDKLATVLKDLIVGELGELDEQLRQEVNERLQILFQI